MLDLIRHPPSHPHPRSLDSGLRQNDGAPLLFPLRLRGLETAPTMVCLRGRRPLLRGAASRMGIRSYGGVCLQEGNPFPELDLQCTFSPVNPRKIVSHTILISSHSDQLRMWPRISLRYCSLCATACGLEPTTLIRPCSTL